MSNNIKKELLGLMQKAVKLEVEKNGNEASRYCPVILHQPKRPKKLEVRSYFLTSFVISVVFNCT